MKHSVITLLLLLLATAGQAQHRVGTAASGAPTTAREHRLVAIGSPMTLSSVAGTTPRMATTARRAPIDGLTALQRPLGYTVTDDIEVTGAAFGTAGTYPVGALISPDMLNGYEGCKIVGLRFALSQTIGRTRAFIYSVEGNELTLVHEQSQRTYEGWNNVFFNGDGIAIQGTETLFFGFDYVETADMVSADEGALCGVGEDTEGAFMAYGNFGSGEGLYSLSNIGCLCVQLIVDVSTLPQKRLSLLSIDTGFKYKRANEDVEIFAIFTNTGLEPVYGYTMACRIDDGQEQLFTVKDTIAPGKQDALDRKVLLPEGISVGPHTLKFYTTAIEGQPVAQSDTLRADFAIYSESLQRHKVYFEVYTDASSYLSWLLNQGISELMSSHGEHIALVNVHRKGTALSLNDAEYLGSLYAYTYPSFTVNRAYFPNEAHIAYDMNDYLPVIPASMTAGILTDMVLQDLDSPSFADVTIGAAYDTDTRQLSLTLSGKALPDAPAIYGELALTVLLTEDAVQSVQQVVNPMTNRLTNNTRYLHPSVLRTYLTAPTGSRLSISDGTWSTTLNTTLSDKWNADNISVVAFLTKYLPEVSDRNVRQADIIDANSVQLSDVIAQGIDAINAGADSPRQLFTIDGKRLPDNAAPAPGIYVERSQGRTRKVVVRQ